MMDESRISPEERNEFVNAWSRTMVDIWQEKLMRLKAVSSGNLLVSVREAGTKFGDQSSDVFDIYHQFLMYGIYVDTGSGREFGGERNELGQLVKDVTRKPKPWFSKKYWASQMVLRDFVAQSYGDEFVTIMESATNNINKQNK